MKRSTFKSKMKTLPVNVNNINFKYQENDKIKQSERA